MKIREVYPGSAAAANNDSFIELQMLAAGQTQVGGHEVKLYTADGTLLAAVPIGAAGQSVPNGESQRTVLIGDTGVAGRDFTYAMLSDTLPAVAGAGAACFEDASPPDCVSWGMFTGNAALPAPAAGTPTLFTTGIPDGSSITRSIAPGCPTLLESTDDTDDSNTDFAQSTPSPRPNSTTPTETACVNGGSGSLDLSAKAKKKQNAGKPIVVKVECSVECEAKGKGKVKLSGGGSSAVAAAKVKLKTKTKQLTADKKKKLKLKPKKKSDGKQLKNAVAGGTKAKAKIKVIATAEGAKEKKKLTVKLK